MLNFLKLLFTLFIVCSALLTGCGASVPMIKPFKMDIQQGNVVTSKMLLQLRPGMTKSQVKFIMGTPLIVDSFHKDRWDYFYQMRRAGKIIEQRRVILDFDKDLLSKVRGDVVPQGTAGAATGEEAGAVTLPKSIEPKPKEKGILDRLKFWEKDEKKVVPAVVPKIEAPKAAAPEAPAADVVEPTPDLPAEVAPPSDLPAAEVPKAEAPAVAPIIEEPTKVEPAVIEPLKVEPPVVQAPAIEAPEATVVIPAAPPPVPAVPEKIVPPAPVKQDDQLIFRLDKNLDSSNIETAPDAAAAPVKDNKAKPKKMDPAPLPDETEPSFFNRMLEKIGF